MSPTPQRLQITAASPDPALLDLPWHIPLEDWPAETLAALPRGISRHIVRFVKMSGRVIAVKEIGETVAYREYELLRQLRRLDVPERRARRRHHRPRPTPTASGSRRCSSPSTCRSRCPTARCSARSLRPDTATRLIDALAVLLVRLHLVGFYWGDVSLSNTLFRRDAETFAAYLVDAETGDLHDRLTDGQRGYDLEVARVNIIGELMDLQAGEFLEEDVDAVAIGDALAERYGELWRALTESETFALRRPLAGAGPHRPPQRPRLRRRRARHHDRRRRHQRA